MTKQTATLALTALLALTGCGATEATVDAPRADNRPAYTTPESCLDALDAADELIQARGLTASQDALTRLVGQAFAAGSHDDLIKGRQILDSIDAETKAATTATDELVHKFNTNAADCRN